MGTFARAAARGTGSHSSFGLFGSVMRALLPAIWGSPGRAEDQLDCQYLLKNPSCQVRRHQMPSGLAVRGLPRASLAARMTGQSDIRSYSSEGLWTCFRSPVTIFRAFGREH